MHIKCHKVLLFFRNTNTVKDYYNIEFRIELSFTKTCKSFLDQRQGVAIFNYNSIEGPIVYVEAESSTRFFGEQDQGGCRE
jgi:hypothetical protein